MTSGKKLAEVIATHATSALFASSYDVQAGPGWKVEAEKTDGKPTGRVLIMLDDRNIQLGVKRELERDYAVDYEPTSGLLIVTR